MRALRQTIIISLSICVISLLTTLVVTVNSIYFLANWYNCLLCIFGGIFASSIVVLLSSLTNQKSRKREIASSYSVPLMQIDNEIRYLSIFSQSRQVSQNSATFSTDDFPKLIESYALLAEKLLFLLKIERMSCISQSQFDRISKILDKHSMAFLESSFKKTCAQACACCSIIAHELRVYPFYTEASQAAEARSVITTHFNCFNELTRAEGQYTLNRNAFSKLISNIIKVPDIDEH